MGQTGPTPRKTNDKRVTRKRVGGVPQRRAPVVMPDPPADWCERTRADYRRYLASEAARILIEDDQSLVFDYFRVRDRIERAWLDEDVATVKRLTDVEQRLAAALGRGPRERARLGIAPDEEPDFDPLGEFVSG